MPRCTRRTRIVDVDEATGYEIWSFFNPRLKRHIVVLVRYVPPPFPIPFRIVQWLDQLWIGAVFHFEYTERRDQTRNIIVEAHIETSLTVEQMDKIMWRGNCALTAFKEEIWDAERDFLEDRIEELFGRDALDLGTFGFYTSSEPELEEDVVFPTAYYVIRYRRPGWRRWRVLEEGRVELELEL